MSSGRVWAARLRSDTVVGTLGARGPSLSLWYPSITLAMRSCSRSAAAAALFVAVAAMPASAQAPISFDDLPASTVFLPQGYAGFNWLGGGDASGVPTTSWLLSSLGNAYQCPTFCQLHQPASGTQNAWGNAGTNLVLSRDTPFDFLSAYLAATDLRGDPFQTVRGFRNGTEIFTMAVALDPSFAMQQYRFNFHGVDEIRFDSRNGYGNLLVDDIVFTPEPATLALFASGFFGILGGVRLSHKKERKDA